MKSIIFLAPPAAGKGTFSDYLVKNYHYVQLSTGDVLRERALQDHKLADFLATGKLVDDETIMAIVKDKLSSIPWDTPFILDGIPRTLHQVEELENILKDLNREVKVIYIDVKKELLKVRITGRRSCPNCHRSYNENIDAFKPKVSGECDVCHVPLVQRQDDNEKSFEVRYDAFEKNMGPVIDYYKSKGNFTTIPNNDLDQTKSLEELRGELD